MQRTENRMRVARKRMGLSVEQLADQVSLSPTSISNYELGKRRPTIAVAKRINEALGVEAFEFTKLEDLPAIKL